MNCVDVKLTTGAQRLFSSVNKPTLQKTPRAFSGIDLEDNPPVELPEIKEKELACEPS